MKKAIGLLLFVACVICLSSQTASSQSSTARVMIPPGVASGHYFTDGVNCTGITYVTPGQWVTVPADEPFTFVMAAASSPDIFNYDFCRANVTFLPKSGIEYVPALKMSDRVCGVQVRELHQGVLGSSVEITLRRYKAPFSQKGKWCGKPLRQ